MASIIIKSNLKHVAVVIGGCNLAGYITSAALETHKITDLVGVGSFVAAAVTLTLRNPAVFTRKIGNEAVSRALQFGGFDLSLQTARVLIVNSIVVAWGVRLSTYLFNRVLKLGEDKRLDKVSQRSFKSYLTRS